MNLFVLCLLLFIVCGTKPYLDGTLDKAPEPVWKHPDWHTEFTCTDFSERPYPKLERSRLVPELVSAEHFDDLLMDVPDVARPPSLVLFYSRANESPTCYKRYIDLHFEYRVKHELPDRAHLMAVKYDMMNAPKRPWYEWTPERDMAPRFGVTACPSIVFFPRTCNGLTDWCQEEMDDGGWIAGCDDFKEQCTGYEIWNGQGDWMKWAKKLIATQTAVERLPYLKDMREQERWMRGREGVTCNTHARNLWITQSMPIFSEIGYKIVKIPEEAYRLLLDFYHRNKHRKRDEDWDTWGSTQMNFHEAPTKIISLDLEHRLRDRLGHMIKPLAEEWVGIKPLELTSFYGIREYYPGSWLRNHVDRIDTHIVSMTLSIHKTGITKPWPLEAVNHLGQTVRYEIPPGYMALYESAKVPHGRPYRLETGMHAGCFLHFRPLNKWENGHLRKKQQQNVEHVSDYVYEQRWREAQKKKNELR